MSHKNNRKAKRETLHNSKIINSSFMKLRSYIHVCSEDKNYTEQAKIKQEFSKHFADYGIVSTFAVFMDWRDMKEFDVEEIPEKMLTQETLQTLTQKTKERTHERVTFDPATSKIKLQEKMKFLNVVSAVFQNNGRYYAMKLPTSDKTYFCEHVLKGPLSRVKMQRCKNFDSVKDRAIFEVEAAKLNESNMTISGENLLPILQKQPYTNGKRIYLKCGDEYYSIKHIFYKDIEALAKAIDKIISKATGKRDGFLDNALDCFDDHDKIRRILQFGVFECKSSTTSKTELCRVFYKCKELSPVLKGILARTRQRQAGG